MVIIQKGAYRNTKTKHEHSQRQLKMKKVILYIHGKDGNSQEVKHYLDDDLDFDIIGIDYHYDVLWKVEPQIMKVYQDIVKRYDDIIILANSIGAYFAMHALQNSNHIAKAFFISPILDMEKLILDMMKWANVTEEQLQKEKEIATEFNETLSWQYLCFVRENPIKWKIPTEILYGANDNMTSYQTVNLFVKNHDAKLTVMEQGEHWFHTDKQIKFLNSWLKKLLK